MRKHYYRIVQDTEKRVDYFLKRQLSDDSSLSNGGLLNNYNYCDPKDAMNIVTSAIAVYINNDSKFYGDKVLLDSIFKALSYLENIQRENGLYDLLNCNFYSAPDTAFGVNRLIVAYKLLKLYGKEVDHEKLKERLLYIIKSSAFGIVQGGFHTPNHRWAIAACLMGAYNLTHVEQFKACADKYLNEGLDANEDGEYAERSAGIYNIVNNEQMMMLAEETNNKVYLTYVEKNLEMMLSYLEPDGTIFTNNSTRQDNDVRMYPVEYYFQYLFIAFYNKNVKLGAVAYEIMEQIIEAGHFTEDCLFRLMLYPELIDYEPEIKGYDKNYSKFYKESGIVRVRKNDISYSLIQNNSKPLFFQIGSLKAYMKIGVSYFAEREFMAQSIEKTSDGFLMDYTAKGWYYMPFDEKPDTTDWWKMDHSKRAQVITPNLNIKIKVTEIEAGIAVNISTSGCDRVPLKIEIGVDKGTFINNEGFMCTGDAGNAVTPKAGEVFVRKGMETMSIGPAFANHFFVDGKFGSEERSKNHFTIYFTDFTEFSHTISFKKI